MGLRTIGARPAVLAGLALLAGSTLGCTSKKPDSGYYRSEFPGEEAFTGAITSEEDMEEANDDYEATIPSADGDVTITCRGRGIEVSRYEGTLLVFKDGELDSLRYPGGRVHLRSTGMGFYFSDGRLSEIDAFDPESGEKFFITISE